MQSCQNLSIFISIIVNDFGGVFKVVELCGEELHNCLLDAGKAFNEICIKHNLKYYLSGGTLLGAVRHHGFIPWDNDMDMMMPRDDYEKLLSLNYNDGRYKVIDCFSDQNYGYSFAKIIDTKTRRVSIDDANQTDFGVYIDIFPIDGYPDSVFFSNLRNLHLRYLRLWRNFMLNKETSKSKRFSGIKNFIRRINPITSNSYSRRINRIGQKKKYADSKYVGVQSGTHVQKNERNPKSIFDKTIYLPFDDTSFPCPSGYDEYLSHLYGDYMQLPPENQRYATHSNKFYYINE